MWCCAGATYSCAALASSQALGASYVAIRMSLFPPTHQRQSGKLHVGLLHWHKGWLLVQMWVSHEHSICSRVSTRQIYLYTRYTERCHQTIGKGTPKACSALTPSLYQMDLLTPTFSLETLQWRRCHQLATSGSISRWEEFSGRTHGFASQRSHVQFLASPSSWLNLLERLWEPLSVRGDMMDQWHGCIRKL